MHENIMVYLVGFPGTGKLTVARELAPLLQAKIVDNHWINNPIFGLLDNDRTTPFPEGVWDQVAKVRQAVLDTIATLSAPAANFILTHAGFDADPEDRAVYDIIVKTAERRGSVFVPVRLLCEEAELVQRVISPERASRLKKHGSDCGLAGCAQGRGPKDRSFQRDHIGHIVCKSAGKRAPHPSTYRSLRPDGAVMHVLLTKEHERCAS
jgi:predicted kinase